MKKFLSFFAALAIIGLVGCASAPIKVGPRPDIEGIENQNIVTQKEIKKFSVSNKKTIQHTQKVEKEAIDQTNTLHAVMRDLNKLLGIR